MIEGGKDGEGAWVMESLAREERSEEEEKLEEERRRRERTVRRRGGGEKKRQRKKKKGESGPKGNDSEKKDAGRYRARAEGTWGWRRGWLLKWDISIQEAPIHPPSPHPAAMSAQRPALLLRWTQT